MEKRWYYGNNYGTIPKTMELWFTKEEDYETLIYNEKKNHGNIPKQKKVFKQIHSVRTLITIEKLLNYGNIYGIWK